LAIVLEASSIRQPRLCGGAQRRALSFSVPPHGVDALRVYGEGFAGHEAELAALDQAWSEGAVRVFVLHAGVEP